MEAETELIGYGIGKAPGGGWLAFRVSNRDGLHVLTPPRAGRCTESQPAAVARMTEAQRIHLTALISGRA